MTRPGDSGEQSGRAPTPSRHDDLRIAVVGFGLAGAAFHAPVIEAVDGLHTAAIVTRDPERAAHARARFPNARVLATVDDLWSSGADWDGVVVAAPNRAHVPLATAAVDAGLPVVVDKPLAVTAREAQALVDHATARGVALTVYQNRRWDADFLTLRRLLDEGELGDVLRFESRFERWRPTPGAGWRDSSDPAEGGGVLLDLGSHLVDQALLLFGPADLAYSAVAARRDGAATDDDAFLVLRHHSGVMSHLSASAVTAHVGPRLRVLGSRAAFLSRALDPQEAALRAGGSPREPDFGAVPDADWGQLVTGDERRPVPSERGGYAAFYEAWRDALRGIGPLPVDPRDAVRTLEILDAARG